MKKNLLIIVIFIIIFACSNNRFTGEKIILPSNVEYFFNDSIVDLHNSCVDTLVLAYFRADCPSCLKNIERFANLAAIKANDNLSFLIILGSYDKFELFKWCVTNADIEINYPVIFDIDETFLNINNTEFDIENNIIILDKELTILKIIKN
jgi:Redoxin.